MSRNNDYKTGNLLDYSCHEKCYKPIGIFIKTNKCSSRNNFTIKLEEHDGVAMFFITEKQQKTILNFSLDSLNLTE